MKRKMLLCLLIAVIGLCGCGKKQDIKEETISAEDISTQLYQANAECVHSEVIRIEENGERKTAILEVEIPDYTKIYDEAFKEDKPDEYILKVLRNKEYDVIKCEIETDVITENGEDFICEETALEKLLEEKLIDAVNAVTEE